MTASTTEQDRALSSLRHLYQQMAGGMVKDSAQAKRIAEGILSPAIAKLEQAARRDPAVPQDQLPPDVAKRAMEELQTEVEKLRSALAECRDACPIPKPGASNEYAWMQSIGDPESVPAFVKSCFGAPAVPVPQGLFEAIEHGDETHRGWLKSALEAFFSGKPIPQEVSTAKHPPATAPVPQGYKITEDQHVAAVKVLLRASGVDGLPQRMLDAMLAAAPIPPGADHIPDAGKMVAAPVQLPEPVYTMRVRGRMHDYTPALSAFDLADGEHKLYTEQQVRQLLAAHGIGKDKALAAEPASAETSATAGKTSKTNKTTSPATERGLFLLSKEST